MTFLAVVVLNFTDELPVKFEPVIVTEVPTLPKMGEKLSIIGGLTSISCN